MAFLKQMFLVACFVAAAMSALIRRDAEELASLKTHTSSPSIYKHTSVRKFSKRQVRRFPVGVGAGFIHPVQCWACSHTNPQSPGCHQCRC